MFNKFPDLILKSQKQIEQKIREIVLKVYKTSISIYHCDNLVNLNPIVKRVEEISYKINVNQVIFSRKELKSKILEFAKQNVDIAIFVVHSQETRLIFDKNEQQGYGQLYHTLQNITGGKVVILIAGDTNKKDTAISNELYSMMLQQLPEYCLNGTKGMVISFDEELNMKESDELKSFIVKKFI